MSKTRCGDCWHYAPARTPETGRTLPTKAGDCTYPVEWPKLPKAFLPDAWTYYGNSRVVQWPKRLAVRKGDDEHCELFAPKPAKKKGGDQMELAP